MNETSQRYVKTIGGRGIPRGSKKDANLKKILRNKTSSPIKQGIQPNEQEGGETIKMKRPQDIWEGLAGYLRSITKKRFKKKNQEYH